MKLKCSIPVREHRRPAGEPLLVLALLALTIGLAGCQSDDASSLRAAAARSRANATDGEKVLTPSEDPRLAPYRERFQRIEAMVLRWDALRGDGRSAEADVIAARLRQEVDSGFADLDRASRGELGPHAQYLSVSALGFSSSPQATRSLVSRLGDRDSRVVGNALIALSVRADPATPTDPLLRYIAQDAPPEPRRYAPLTLAKVIEARRKSGRPDDQVLHAQALGRLAPIAVDHDPIVRLHVAKALGTLRTSGAYDPLRVLTGDPQMRIRWAAAAGLEQLGDPRGFPDVVRLLHDVSADSKHIIRDVLISYAGKLQGRALTQQEIERLGTGARAWSQWFNQMKQAKGIRGA